jgi:hypothetical protein
MKEPSAVEWLVEQLTMQTSPYTKEQIIEIAKEMEDEQKKQLVIGTYIDLKMKNNKLPYGMKYINKISELEEEAEKYYNKTFKTEKVGRNNHLQISVREYIRSIKDNL